MDNSSMVKALEQELVIVGKTPVALIFGSYT